VARIIDKNTRLIDVDFGALDISVSRQAAEILPDIVITAGDGVSQLLNFIPPDDSLAPAPPVRFGLGSFIQYDRLDLSFMTINNEIMLPTEVSVQRTSPVPLGSSLNGNNFDQIEEFIFILSRPLDNTFLANLDTTQYYEILRDLGLDGSSGGYLGFNVSGKAGWPTQSQTIYAEKRMYSYSANLMATIANGELQAAPSPYNSIAGMPMLDSVTSWGSMGAITGPNLHCYRVIINRNQSFPALPIGTFNNTAVAGTSVCNWPPVSIRFLCTDPGYSEGEYLTRLANAMNSIAEDAETANP
jgi:hypothetical protein